MGFFSYPQPVIPIYSTPYLGDEFSPIVNRKISVQNKYVPLVGGGWCYDLEGVVPKPHPLTPSSLVPAPKTLNVCLEVTQKLCLEVTLVPVTNVLEKYNSSNLNVSNLVV